MDTCLAGSRLRSLAPFTPATTQLLHCDGLQSLLAKAALEPVDLKPVRPAAVQTPHGPISQCISLLACGFPAMRLLQYTKLGPVSRLSQQQQLIQKPGLLRKPDVLKVSHVGHLVEAPETAWCSWRKYLVPALGVPVNFLCPGPKAHPPDGSLVSAEVEQLLGVLLWSCLMGPSLVHSWSTWCWCQVWRLLPAAHGFLLDSESLLSCPKIGIWR